MTDVEFAASGDFLLLQMPFLPGGGQWPFAPRRSIVLIMPGRIPCRESSRLRDFISQYPNQVGVTTRSGREEALFHGILRAGSLG